MVLDSNRLHSWARLTVAMAASLYTHDVGGGGGGQIELPIHSKHNDDSIASNGNLQMRSLPLIIHNHTMYHPVDQHVSINRHAHVHTV